MKETADVIVVGAGVIGLMTARELAGEGLSVTVLDRGPVGQRSAYAAGGILSAPTPWRTPQAVRALAEWGQQSFAPLVDELHEETGIDAEWVRSGALIFEVADTDAASAWASAHEGELEVLGGDALRECEPAAASDWESGVFLPQVAQVRTPNLIKALARSLTVRGVRVHEHAQVEGLALRGSRVIGVRTKDAAMEAGKVILAAGAWTNTLLSSSGGGLDIRPVRGQMLWYQTEPGAISRILMHEERYVVPRRDGVCVVGGTVEDVGFDPGVTEESAHILRTFANRLAPMLADLEPMGQWSGLRPGNVSGIPSIGPYPGPEGLYVSTGHLRNGIPLGPASARLITDLVLNREPILPPAPYALAK